MQPPSNYGWDIPPANESGVSSGGNRERTIQDIFKRMWIPIGATRTVVFIPDKEGNVIPYKLWEYQITDHSKKGAAKWNNFERVPEDPRNDWIANVLKPSAGDIIKKQFIGAVTVMVLDTYVDGNGKTRGPFLNVVPFKLNHQNKGPLAMAKRHHDKYGSLAWRKYSWTRDTQKDASACGNDWMMEEVVNPNSLPWPENLEQGQPLQCVNWNEYFRVKSHDELAAKYGHLIQGAPPQQQHQNQQWQRQQQQPQQQRQNPPQQQQRQQQNNYNQNNNYNQQQRQQPPQQQQSQQGWGNNQQTTAQRTTDQGYPQDNRDSVEQVDY